ncbi:hypothetical protein [Anaeromyxobacter diazotrophicus]|uniref:Lipoprotein n=1 Tax=Anaeromyxobacter diazotrophicus TaxID=2590199 RepID=A0A7I9VLT0_9BACT|nr:hypothetical protein [Anaeromyxobacter diazotrophicus]GEJ57069.1 hypothetical protein AMYX_18100 [Anaeromyxobacter diazotrophicus]
MTWKLPAVLALALGSASTACTRAQAFESFTLEDSDKLIAEAPGCNAECQAAGPHRRICTLKDDACRAICQTVPECKLEGTTRLLQVCAVVRSNR